MRKLCLAAFVCALVALPAGLWAARVKPTLLEEGWQVTRTRGRIRVYQDQKVAGAPRRLLFVTTGRRFVFTLLENKLLEQFELREDLPAGREYLVSGSVTTYQRKNYLLLRRMPEPVEGSEGPVAAVEEEAE